MKPSLRLAAIAASLFTSAFAGETPKTDAVDVATDYLAAYSTFDVAKMAPFYADDAAFNDPTSHGQIPGQAEFTFEGKDAILKGLGTYAAGYNAFSVHYDIRRRFVSAGNVVFIADLTYEGETKSGEKFSGGAPIVTVIKVTDGKVSRHTDYFDYEGNSKDFDAQSH